MTSTEELVYKILSGLPITIVDDINNEIYENPSWELSAPRTTGDYAGSREIGSGNMVTAYNIIYLKNINTEEESMSHFEQLIDNLVEHKLIRRKPEVVRKTFKVIK